MNVLHRPVTGVNYPYYKLQQEYAHRLKLKVTLVIPAASLEDDRMVEEILRDQQEYGDELALWLWRGRPEWGGNAPYWLLSKENKRKTLAHDLELFRGKLGQEPVSIGSYLFDSQSMELIRELSPSTTTVTAGCFEEGTKVFHGCNHSWYLFSEGMSWGPWYAAKGHSFRPAADESDWSGLVAIPHLSRDLALAYEGRNDFFASHPANVQRGLANRGLRHPYDFNLIDQYRMQENMNDGYSFYHVHVSPPWLGDNPNVQDPPEISQQIYLETLEYLAQLRDEGSIRDMHMKEFGEWYKLNMPFHQPAVALGKDMLYGSGKHYMWYIDPAFRVLIDANQGGSIGDLRPYAGRFAAYSGPDSPMREMASYPYLIQSQLRTGTVHHSSDGARTTLYVTAGTQTLDLCECQTRVAAVDRDGSRTRVTLTPAALHFKSGLKAQIETVYEFTGEGVILINRRLLSISDPAQQLGIQEYFKGCYGFTEYAEDLHGIVLEVCGEESRQELAFQYGSRGIKAVRGQMAAASVPQISTRVALESMNTACLSAEAEEGHLFNPYFTLKLNHILSDDRREAAACLTIRKA